MKNSKVSIVAVLIFLATLQVVNAANILKPVALPPREGEVVGAAFSPDNNSLVVIRHSVVPAAFGPRLVIQVVSLRSGQELAYAEVLKGEPAELASNMHYISYSPDGRRLLLATNGSDLISILDAGDLRSEKQFTLHRDADTRKPLRGGHRYFKGVVSLAVASKADTFAVLTHDALQNNEVFICSFASGQIMSRWSLGRSRSATQLGQISLSLSKYGSRVAVSALPDGNSLPKDFSNLRLYNAGSGELMKSIRADGLLGPIVFLSAENVLASRIDMPGFFSKKACIEEWSFGTQALGSRFCDPGRNVNTILGTSLAANRVVGFASHMHKSIEGQVYSVSGRVDVWDLRSGDLIASSPEIQRLVSFLQVSKNGEWIMAGQTLFQLCPTPQYWLRYGAPMKGAAGLVATVSALLTVGF